MASLSEVSPGYYLNSNNVPTNCPYFDAAAPGTGPMGLVSAKAQSTEFEKWNGSFNYSLKSKSDLNLNPQPEGNVYGVFPKAEQNRAGIYAIETDRGELSATANTQVNISGQKTFQNRLQDPVRPTMKETTLYTYNGTVAPVTKAQATYTQFIPQYAKIGGKEVRVGGSSNFGLRTATEYSYFATPGPTPINGQAIQNPDARLGKNTQPVPDFNVDGAGTLTNALPDGSRYQQYRLIAQPTTSGLKFNYNVETDGGSIHDYSQLLGKEVEGIENRYTASYQIAPLLTNPLNVIWDPDNKGTIPALYGNDKPTDFAYANMKDLPPDRFYGGGYSDVWSNDTSKTSTNAYILGLEQGIHNQRLEWSNGVNTLPGIVYTPEDSGKEPTPMLTYGGDKSVFDQYLNNISQSYPNNTYTTLGMPTSGYLS
uniref:Uncharacterized protein n=1 Tax=viral metagenome TaxID=1070528 RepID=A0A6C0B0R2_9ZZZZ